MINRRKNYFINLIFPACVFGSVTGVLTAVVVTLYKVCARYVMKYSEKGYQFLRENIRFIPIVLAALFLIALVYAFIYKKNPNLRGGGIPTSIGILRGVIRFKWIRNLVGVFFLSLTSFFIGVPLGNEGPSVQMGTAVGRGTVFTFAPKHKAWDRYSMTGGACAGFSVATGAPISGIIFAVEEAHQRISPMIIIVASISVLFARITTEILAPVFGVGITLFPEMNLVTLSLKDIWIPVLIGTAIGFFAVLFLYYYKFINTFFNKKLKKVPNSVKMFLVFFVTIVFGLISYSFISTGHDLILSLFDSKIAIYMLLIILLVRSTLTLSANTNKITGGIFLPILALGAILASVLGKSIDSLFGVGEEYYIVILVLGITACISGMMKMPLTAIVFAVEAMSCYGNIIYVIVAAAVSFMITEIFGAKSINDSVLDSRIEETNEGCSIKVIDTFVKVKKGSFATGKQVRDIFWPANLFVLSVKRKEVEGAEVDEHGGKEIHEGDVLHIRYSTTDEAHTKAELTAILGEQEYNEDESDVI